MPAFGVGPMNIKIKHSLLCMQYGMLLEIRYICSIAVTLASTKPIHFVLCLLIFDCLKLNWRYHALHYVNNVFVANTMI